MNKRKIKIAKAIRLDYTLKSIKDEDISIVEYPALYRQFDHDGKLLEELSYDSNGNLAEKYSFVYKDGILKEQIIFMDDESIGEHKFFEYSDGRISKIITKYAENYSDETAISYDAEGRLISKITYDEGEEGEKHLYEYSNDSNTYKIFDDYGKLETQEKRKFSSEGNLVQLVTTDYKDDIETTTDYTYNDKNFLIEEISRNKKNLIISNIIYSYDEKGNIEKSVLSTGKTIITSSYKYDDHNNEIEHIESNKEGEINHSIVRTYDEDGNILTTEAEIFMHGMGIDSKYALKYDYIFFE